MAWHISCFHWFYQLYVGSCNTRFMLPGKSFQSHLNNTRHCELMQLEERSKWNVTETVAYHTEWPFPSSPLPNWSGSVWAPASHTNHRGETNSRISQTCGGTSAVWKFLLTQRSKYCFKITVLTLLELKQKGSWSSFIHFKLNVSYIPLKCTLRWRQS